MSDASPLQDRRRGRPPAQPSVRFTVRVPASDESVRAWWAAQYDPSASVRALIRDEIMRNGFTDAVNRPVRQMPRRGRPPAVERVVDELDAAPALTPIGSQRTVSDMSDAANESVSQQAPMSHSQIDMDDIFGHGS